MMQDRLERRVNRVNLAMVEMSSLVNEAVKESLEAFQEGDLKLATSVIEGDSLVNLKELEIDKKCIELIALQQPVSKALREIISVMKASSDLERIGDHAASIGKAVLLLEDKPRYPEIEEQLLAVGDIIYSMGEEAIEAFIKGDSSFAKEIASHNQEVAALYSHFYDVSVKKMTVEPASILTVTEYQKIGHYLERIGDYITNVCEWSVYRETGDMIDLN
ncbi:phosphate signaling complex protein PhoU [Vagococcus fessus]|uniref:Phosphate-specific transport system accessory protein PhoU n=1 Tax=Vagococcus fessus TaxID=120370 RepID=A0A430ACF4_9ENTE|nr:phosphate signaling complex protein PhoU [Vagococcus fessus]RSU04888.1 phosphate transport system regulatory protein PhoU [Vagococcus fessus]